MVGCPLSRCVVVEGFNVEVWVHIPLERLTSALISDSLQSHLTLAESFGGDVEFCRDQGHVRRYKLSCRIHWLLFPVAGDPFSVAEEAGAAKLEAGFTKRVCADCHVDRTCVKCG